MGEQLTLVNEPQVTARVREMCTRAGLSEATQLRYAKLIESWEGYCALKQESVWDASTETLLHWLDHQMRRHTTINHCHISLAAVRHAQRAYAPEEARLVPYTRAARPRLNAYVAEVMRLTNAPVKGAKPLLGADIRRCVEFVRMNARPRHGVHYQHAMQLARRNAAALLVGWWGMMRSQELASLTWDDVQEVPEGLEIWIANSKTGPAKLALARQGDPSVCPVIALMEWHRSALTDPLYLPLRHLVFQMTRFNVCKISKAIARDAGLAGKYSAHSLRAGFATEAAAQHIDDRKVMRHGRWQSRATHDKYVRNADLWEMTPTTLVTI
jgi:integrase